jgi:hypothetical protein
MGSKRRKVSTLAIGAAFAIAVVGVASAAQDFGVTRDQQLASNAEGLYGFGKPVAQSSHSTVSKAQADADPALLATFAKGLHVSVVTSGKAAPNIDQITLWPGAQNPQWLIACNEEGEDQPGLQRINIATGAVKTIVSGLADCDPTRRTAWRTLLFGLEDGQKIFEMTDPTHTTNVKYDSTTDTFSGGTGAGNIVRLTALGTLSFEGLGLLPNGVLYYGDENRPANGTPGGAYFKFIPDNPYPGGAPISDLSQSPLQSGTVYGLRLGKRESDGVADYGQGTNTGLGTWVEIGSTPDQDLRQASADNGLAGFYRPEDLEVDPPALASGDVKVCGTNTGNESTDRNFGESVCITDGTEQQATANTATPELQDYVVGNPQLAMPDNIAFQPGTDNAVLHEDGDGPLVGRNNDLWDCLPDGNDADLLADGCVRAATLNDLEGTEGDGAEWTGGVFDASGTRFFVSVQHNVTGHGVVLEVTGWQ